MSISKSALVLSVTCIIGTAALVDAKQGAKHDSMQCCTTNNGQMDMTKCMGMMKDGLGKGDKEYDLRFLNMMIQHHQGAVDMAKDALSKAQHPELKQQASQIIDAQEKEIKQMKEWRSKWYHK